MGRTTIIAALAFLAGASAGAYGGFRGGMSFILNDALRRDAFEARQRIETIELIRAGKKDDAIEKLERGLDGAMVVFDPQIPYRDLRPETKADLSKVIAQAKAYRDAHPWTKKSFEADMVRSLFARDPYKN